MSQTKDKTWSGISKHRHPRYLYGDSMMISPEEYREDD